MAQEERRVEAIVGGLICLDVIFPVQPGSSWSTTVAPGRLSETGPVNFAVGGAVPNTGLTLHKLGIATDLCGAVADDVFGNIILNLLNRESLVLSKSIIRMENENTSYSAVINAQGFDRAFLHHPGVNSVLGGQFFADNVIEKRPTLFHFGYPPLMRQMYQNDGQELANMMELIKQAGIMTSLDMTPPDTNGEAGQADWYRILEKCLPHVSIFCPSIEEIRFMMSPIYKTGPSRALTLGEDLQILSEKLLAMGPTIVLIKLGENGLYLRSKKPLPESQGNSMLYRFTEEYEILAPCFQVDAKGTTGAGDAAIGGFLAAILKGSNPKDCLRYAAAIGACCVEQIDATSGILSWEATTARIISGWKLGKPASGSEIGEGWKWNDQEKLWIGPNR